ncbi:AzlC family ABC transporter permease [Rhizobium sp. KVB221]|uniref:AzlC family ABC transporter permease n=1 Tax=Rhizobium setariae TaxID=2801340 RepID=A0A936YT97_9HYPH|nr:AzlC family ABC transporter permease [Rhizobium setariae]MBL0374456.1 AzlC family ABC transporter permease [Rhizobium setariae]
MNRDEIISGIRTALPTLLSALPFAILLGAVSSNMGLSIGEILLMNMTVYAGASQLVGIELFKHDIAPWLVVVSIFAVNFRHILYSAALAAHIEHFNLGQKIAALFVLVDPQFAESLKRAESGKKLSFTWYMSFGLTFYITWQITAVIGAVFGKFVGDPRALGLDVLLTVYFLGLVLGFRNKDNWLPTVVASAVASTAAWHFVGSPWHVSIGAVAGIAVAAALPLKARPQLEATPEAA